MQATREEYEYWQTSESSRGGGGLEYIALSTHLHTLYNVKWMEIWDEKKSFPVQPQFKVKITNKMYRY